MSKKIYSLLLVVVMLFTFSSASVFASDVTLFADYGTSAKSYLSISGTSLSGISFSIVRYNRTSRMTPIILYANTNNPYSFVISNFSTANTSTTVNRAVIAVNNTDLISYYKTFSVTRT